MLNTLRFVTPAIARKDYVPELQHFKITPGNIMATNGDMTICSPLDLDIDVAPNAIKFIKAIRACEDENTTGMTVTPTHRLSIRSGRFRALVPCLPETSPTYFTMPQGDAISFTKEQADLFIIGLRTLAPFASIDASRPWAQGIHVTGRTMIATNNIIVAEYWLGVDLPIEFTIPMEVVTQLIANKDAPIGLQICSTSITFWYAKAKWIKSQLIAEEFPDVVKNIFDKISAQSAPVAFADEFFDTLLLLKPFVNDFGHVYIMSDELTTTLDDDAGASYELLTNDGNGQLFRLEQLLSLSTIATKIDLTSYPNPCMFTGPSVRGLIGGMSR